MARLGVIFLVGLSCLVAFLSYLLTPPTPIIDLPDPIAYPALMDLVGYPIPQNDWSPDKPGLATGLINGPARPRVLKNTTVTKWPALRKWTPEYFAKHHPGLITGVYASDSPVFGPLWRTKKPMAAGLTWKHPHQHVDVTAEKFFSHIQPSSQSDSTPPPPPPLPSQRFQYYTGDLNMPKLIDDIKPYQDLALQKERVINVWIGQAHVKTHLHFDTYDNFYVQVYGTKRFILMDPKHYHAMYPYPFLHPSYGQSQVELDHHNSAELAVKFPRFLQHAEYASVDLEPGDVLYIPPLWWHYVEALECSISVNLWHVSQWQERYDQAMKLTIQALNHQATPVAKRSVVRTIYTRLIPRIFPGTRAAAFLRELLTLRYAAVMAQDPGVLPAHVPGLCPPPLSHAEEEAERQQPPPTPDDTLETLLSGLVDKFAPMPSPGVQHVYVMDYVEALALWGSGSGQHAGALLACFAEREG